MPIALFLLHFRWSLHSAVSLKNFSTRVLLLCEVYIWLFRDFVCNNRVDCADARDELVCSDAAAISFVDPSIVLNATFDPTTSILQWDKPMRRSPHPLEYGISILEQNYTRYKGIRTYLTCCIVFVTHFRRFYELQIHFRERTPSRPN